MRGLLRSYLDYFLLLLAPVGFAVAQPLYSVLGENAEFLVAHHVTPTYLLIMVVFLSFGIAAILAILPALVSLLSRLHAQVTFGIMLGGLVATIALPLVGRLDLLPVGGAIAVAALVGLVVAALSPRLSGFLRFASPIAVVFPILFLFFTPARDILIPSSSGLAGVKEVGNPAPIVMIVLDEFNPTVLLDEEGNIDRVRFPNFAALADEGAWFPNALSVHFSTKVAVPAILTGKMPPEGNRLPTLSDHPDNLFSWLAPKYKMNVIESATRLCPANVCVPDMNLGELVTDTSIVLFHEILPRPIAQDLLPPIDEGWGAFGAVNEGEGERAAAPKSKFREWVGLARSVGRINMSRQFIGSIDASDGVLNFLHILLPHRAWSYNSDGREYIPTRPMGMKDGVWTDEEFMAVGYHRYMLQVGLLDRLVGETVAKLKQMGRYDQTIFMIAADHGISFKVGTTARGIHLEEPSQHLRIPFFAKLPKGSAALDTDAVAYNIDLVPTIADVIQADMNWDHDGVSLFKAGSVPRETLVVARGANKMEYRVKEILAQDELKRWHLDRLGAGVPLKSTVVRGARRELLGTPVSDLAIGPVEEAYVITADLSQPFADIGLSGAEQLPLLVRGELLGDQKAVPDVVVVLNGKIVLVLRPRPGRPNVSNFLGLVPESDLVEGRNEFAVYAIGGNGAGVTLHPLNIGDTPPKVAKRPEQAKEEPAAIPVSAKQDGPLWDGLVAAGEEDIVARMAIRTSPDDSTSYVAAGWAVDTRNKVPASRIVVTRGERVVLDAKPDRIEKKVAKRFGTDPLLKSAFQLPISAGDAASKRSELRVFVVAGDQYRELVPCARRGLRWC